MFGLGSFPDKAACNSAVEYFREVNPHFIVSQSHAVGEVWRAYVQYVEPISKLGHCITCQSSEVALRTKERMSGKGIFATYYSLRRGDDAFILNLIDYKPSIEELLLNNIYGQLVIANYAENWFVENFGGYDRENFSQTEPIINRINSDYHAFLSKKNIPERKSKKTGWEGGVYSWHALGQSLIKNNVSFQSNKHLFYKDLSEIKYQGDQIELIYHYIYTSLNQYGLKLKSSRGEHSNFLGRVLKAESMTTSGENVENPKYKYWSYEYGNNYASDISNYSIYHCWCKSCFQKISPHEIDTLIELEESNPFEICHQCAHELRDKALLEREKILDEMSSKHNGDPVPDIFKVIDSGDEIDLILMLSKNPELVSNVNNEGWMPIHVLASQGEDTNQIHLEMVRELLRFGSDANSLSLSGWTPIHLIAINGASESVPIAKLLFQSGANVLTTTGDGVTDWKLLWQHGQEIYDLFERQESNFHGAR